MRLNAVTLLLALLGLPSCTPDPKAPHPVTDTDKCPDAEKNLLKLGCTDSRGELLGGPNKSGISFTQRCQEAHTNKLWMNPVCLAGLTTCGTKNKEVDACLQPLDSVVSVIRLAGTTRSSHQIGG